MGLFTYLVTVESLGLNDESEFSYHMLRAESFTEAVKKITDYFKKDLISFSIKESEDYCGEMTKETYEACVKMYEERY